MLRKQMLFLLRDRGRLLYEAQRLTSASEFLALLMKVGISLDEATQSIDLFLHWPLIAHNDEMLDHHAAISLIARFAKKKRRDGHGDGIGDGPA